MHVQRENRVENQLLSPWRGRRAVGPKHEGKIVTDAPNQMWGTDGTKILTVEDGWIWLFTAIEHWNAECVGWYVAKVGSRYAALEPVSMGLKKIYGSLASDIGRGGIQPSFGFIQEPETNGVAVERAGHLSKGLSQYRGIESGRCRIHRELQRALAHSRTRPRAQTRLPPLISSSSTL